MGMDLHLISFDVPFPPVYGGVMDVFHKLRWLHKEGVKVHLHTFTYRSKAAPELESYCAKISYYPRGSMLKALFAPGPMITSTRNHPRLAEHILSQKAPVLCEGVHTAGFAGLFREKGLPVFLRAHNVEHEYYRGLASYGGLKSLYYREEARRLAHWEKGALSFSGILAISTSDAEWFTTRHPNLPVVWTPPFHALDTKVPSSPTSPPYALFHGNLAIPENHAAAVFLIQEVFSGLSMPLVVAGANPSEDLKAVVQKFSYVQLQANPSFEDMERWIKGAAVVVLPAMQSSGVKLKLIQSLMHEKVVIANQAMMAGTGLQSYVYSAESPSEWKAWIQEKVWEKPKVVESMNEALLAYDNKNNIKRLIEFIYTNA